MTKARVGKRSDVERSQAPRVSFLIATPSAHSRESGRYDAKAIAQLLGLSVSDVAKIIRERPDSVRRRPDARSYQTGLGDLARLIGWLGRVFKDNATMRMWLNASNDELGGRSPLSVMLAGKLAVVLDLVYSALTAQGV